MEKKVGNEMEAKVRQGSYCSRSAVVQKCILQKMPEGRFPFQLHSSCFLRRRVFGLDVDSSKPPKCKHASRSYVRFVGPVWS